MSFYSDIDTAVACLRPLLKQLRIREDISDDRRVSLIEIPELGFLNMENWTLSLVREKSLNPMLCGRLVARYRKPHNLFQFIIYLNETLFYKTESSKMKRKVVTIHEFTHFVAYLYSFSANENQSIESLENRLDNTIEEIFNPDVSTLLDLLSKKEPKKKNDLTTFKHSQHTHFHTGLEKINISYTDLYLNLLFSKGSLEEFFDIKKQKEFYRLWKTNKRSEALDFYHNLVKLAAKEKWIPVEFALNQADEWIIEYIRNPL